MKRCPKCSKQYPDEANFCPVDAGRLEPDPGSTQRGHPVSEQDAARVTEPVADPYGGRFEIGEQIGGGITGDVYRATDRQSGTPCIVKRVYARVFPNAILKQRTERELKQLERLSAEQVARVLGFGRDGDTLWIASELVEGRSLFQLVAEGGRLQPERACHLTRLIAVGLAEAARHGVIHRDVAAKNVLVGEDDRVKLINFPIAAPSEGNFSGVPEYLSPEQVEGRPADQRSSIYSLGVLMYLALTGQPPFTGDPKAVRDAHLHREVTPPSQIAPVPQAVEQIVLKALEKSSARRFMTLQQLIGELDGVLASGAAAARPPADIGEAVAAAGKGKPAALGQTLLGVAAFQRTGEGAAAGQAASTQIGRPAPTQARGDATEPAGQPATSEPEPPAQAPQPAQPAAAAPAVANQAHIATQMVEPERMRQMSRDAAAKPVPGSPEDPLVATLVDPPAALPEPVPDRDPYDRQSSVSAREPRSTVPAGGKKGKGKQSTAAPSAKQSPAKAGGSGGKFRETMWFKKGELDAAAAQAAAAAKNKDIVTDKADEMPIEDRYRDDGSISNQDAERLSLRTGATQMLQSVQEQPRAERARSVSEEDLVDEMNTGKKTFIIAAVAAVVLIAGIIAFFAAS